MVRRLIESDYAANGNQATLERIRFWSMESRTPGILVELASRFPEVIRNLVEERPLLASGLRGDVNALENELAGEERAERNRDRVYWKPLVKELESLRHRERPS